MILWEIKQITNSQKPETAFFTERLMRISRYFDMLTTSFDIMGDGMEVEQYMKFRNTLNTCKRFSKCTIPIY
jgi:tryptophan 2,3-dioxygenase